MRSRTPSRPFRRYRIIPLFSAINGLRHPPLSDRGRSGPYRHIVRAQYGHNRRSTGCPSVPGILQDDMTRAEAFEALRRLDAAAKGEDQAETEAWAAIPGLPCGPSDASHTPSAELSCCARTDPYSWTRAELGVEPRGSAACVASLLRRIAGPPIFQRVCTTPFPCTTWNENSKSRYIVIGLCSHRIIGARGSGPGIGFWRKAGANFQSLTALCTAARKAIWH
jgi:hypothetical protein